MFRRDLLILSAFMVAPAVLHVAAQQGAHVLVPRQVPCQIQYAKAVETIGLARWSAPEAERPSIERLLNAASKAKELVDASFEKWEAPLCSAETLGKLHASVQTIESNGWLPATPEERREAEAAAANAELLKAINAGLGANPGASRPQTSSVPPSQQEWSRSGDGIAN